MLNMVCRDCGHQIADGEKYDIQNMQVICYKCLRGRKKDVLRFKVLEKGCEPYKKHFQDAGYDIKSRTNTYIYPSTPEKIPTGLCVEIPPGYAGLIRARSSSTIKGLEIHGTIDSDYRGEIFLLCNNASNNPIQIKQYERIAQLVVVPCLIREIELVEELTETERGCNGFGSTGK